jgi:predicted nucleic acid-binding protein
VKEKTVRLYLDNCCYHRPFDDLTQERIAREADAVNLILSLSKKGTFNIVSSIFVDMEMNRTPSAVKRRKFLEIYRYDEYYKLDREIENAARLFQSYGLKLFDSLHLAVAETKQVDFLLTTDDDFIKQSTQFEHKTKVINPYNFIKGENYYDIEY